MTMPLGLRALLRNSINYAGWAPPAKTPVAEVPGKYLGYARDAAVNFMLGRLTMKVGDLGKITDEHMDHSLLGGRLPVSILGSGGKTAEEFKANLQADGHAIEAFKNQFRNQVVVDIYETRLPGEALVDFQLQTPLYSGMKIYCEMDPGLGEFVQFTKALAFFNSRIQSANVPSYGFKLRCGGESVPSPEQVALVLHGCAKKKLPLSLTSGLHHPFRHVVDEKTGAEQHGFINVMTAGVFAFFRKALTQELQDILSDKNLGHFIFTDEGLEYGPFAMKATLVEIGEARQKLMVAFGSCSFEEPMDDLKKLGLL